MSGGETHANERDALLPMPAAAAPPGREASGDVITRYSTGKYVARKRYERRGEISYL